MDQSKDMPKDGFNSVLRIEDWEDPEFVKFLKELKIPPDQYYRRFWEEVQLLRGLKRLNLLDNKKRILSVGAGCEAAMFYLSNKVDNITGIDLYKEGKWPHAPKGMLSNPSKYTELPFNKNRLTIMDMDARNLKFEDDSFDVVYSISSVEHFGCFREIRRSMEEMARVLKKDGILVISTEYIMRYQNPLTWIFDPFLGIIQDISYFRSKRPTSTLLFNKRLLKRMLLSSVRSLRVLGDIDYRPSMKTKNLHCGIFLPNTFVDILRDFEIWYYRRLKIRTEIIPIIIFFKKV